MGETERQVEYPWAIRWVAGEAFYKPVSLLDVGHDGRSWHVNRELLPFTSEQVILDPIRQDVPADLAGAGVQFVVGDACVLPEDWTGRFDVVMCVSTIDHIGEPNYGLPAFPEGPALAMREMMRVLAPGGLLLLTAPVGEEGRYPWVDGMQHVFGVSEFLTLIPGDGRIDGWQFWRLYGDDYKLCRRSELNGVTYAHYRAEGVGAIAFRKPGN